MNARIPINCRFFFPNNIDPRLYDSFNRLSQWGRKYSRWCNHVIVVVLDLLFCVWTIPVFRVKIQTRTYENYVHGVTLDYNFDYNRSHLLSLRWLVLIARRLLLQRSAWVLQRFSVSREDIMADHDAFVSNRCDDDWAHKIHGFRVNIAHASTSVTRY